VSSGEDGEGGGVVIYMPQLEELPDEEKEGTSESKESPAT